MNHPALTANTLADFSRSRPLWTALALTLAFSGLARWVRGVTFSGAIAGAGVCFLLYAGAGRGAFCALVSVFALTWITTRTGYRRKQRLGTAENRQGRTAAQVLANLAVSAGCAALFAATGKTVLLLAVAAALSEAAADTVSSELGQARNEEARLITTWESVPAGTDGGVSVIGTLGGISAATLVSLVCVFAKLIPFPQLGIPILAGVAGMIADSYMGALLERRKLLNNDWVNFFGTLTAAAVAISIT
ncbi:MAG: DUF92 domain-containing protein [Terriglobales bacterium]